MPSAGLEHVGCICGRVHGHEPHAAEHADLQLRSLRQHCLQTHQHLSVRLRTDRLPMAAQARPHTIPIIIRVHAAGTRHATGYGVQTAAHLVLGLLALGLPLQGTQVG